MACTPFLPLIPLSVGDRGKVRGAKKKCFPGDTAMFWGTFTNSQVKYDALFDTLSRPIGGPFLVHGIDVLSCSFEQNE